MSICILYMEILLVIAFVLNRNKSKCSAPNSMQNISGPEHQTHFLQLTLSYIKHKVNVSTWRYNVTDLRIRAHFCVPELTASANGKYALLWALGEAKYTLSPVGKNVRFRILERGYRQEIEVPGIFFFDDMTKVGGWELKLSTSIFISHMPVM